MVCADIICVGFGAAAFGVLPKAFLERAVGLGIRIIDITLRDGGIVNDFNFGEENMRSVISALEASGVSFIELGYLEKNRGSVSGRSQYVNERVIEDNVLLSKKPGCTYMAMMDYGKFDADALSFRSPCGIDAVRLAFHRRNYEDAMPLYDVITDKGYDAYIQPMVTLHYSDAELKELCRRANCTSAKGVYFVDTFGQMRPEDIVHMTEIFDTYLSPDIAVGFHPHNNIRKAYENAVRFLKIPLSRDKLLDSSIMGMGRGAGNLNTEHILSHLNRCYGEEYDLSPVREVMNSVIDPIREEHPWGYSVEYALSAENDCSPVYASYFYRTHGLSFGEVDEILKLLRGEKRISFDREYADEVYRKFCHKFCNR